MALAQQLNGKTAVAVEEILQERKRQLLKWGEQSHDPGYWLMILQKEIGEAVQAILDLDPAKAHKELVQVSAVALAWLEDNSVEPEGEGLAFSERAQEAKAGPEGHLFG